MEKQGMVITSIWSSHVLCVVLCARMDEDFVTCTTSLLGKSDLLSEDPEMDKSVKLLRVSRKLTFTISQLRDMLDLVAPLHAAGLADVYVSVVVGTVLACWFDRYTDEESEAVGQRVVISKDGSVDVHYYHYGAQVGDTIYHFCDRDGGAGFLLENPHAAIRGVNESEFRGTDVPEVVIPDEKILRFDEALEVAQSFVEKRSKYRLTRFNCEHAARLIVCGKASSTIHGLERPENMIAELREAYEYYLADGNLRAKVKQYIDTLTAFQQQQQRDNSSSPRNSCISLSYV